MFGLSRRCAGRSRLVKGGRKREKCITKLIAKNKSSLGGFEPPTFRLTAERANRLRHRDGRYEFMTPPEEFLPTEAVNRNKFFSNDDHSHHLSAYATHTTVIVANW